MQQQHTAKCTRMTHLYSCCLRTLGLSPCVMFLFHLKAKDILLVSLSVVISFDPLGDTTVSTWSHPTAVGIFH